MAFDVRDFHPGLREKASALCYSLRLNHPFVDGNKRVGHAAMVTILVLNSHEIRGGFGGSQAPILEVTFGRCTREHIEAWLRQHVFVLRGRRRMNTRPFPDLSRAVSACVEKRAPGGW